MYTESDTNIIRKKNGGSLSWVFFRFKLYLKLKNNYNKLCLESDINKLSEISTLYLKASRNLYKNILGVLTHVKCFPVELLSVIFFYYF